MTAAKTASRHKPVSHKVKPVSKEEEYRLTAEHWEALTHRQTAENDRLKAIIKSLESAKPIAASTARVSVYKSALEDIAHRPVQTTEGEVLVGIAKDALK